MKIYLPFLGPRAVSPDLNEAGHWLWMSLLGWHHCTTTEDYLIRRMRKQMDQVAA